MISYVQQKSKEGRIMTIDGALRVLAYCSPLLAQLIEVSIRSTIDYRTVNPVY